ncbi:putative transcription factor bHLH family [Helianthus annuus]|uniref:Putative basic helix-loop-helix (BHLH) DNA-binding superfamily protein n=1 Tax=Helianthus annuus TaxID=4232 RepID=A0A251V8K5_HELAN|nr:transcription factor bHLH123 isoform X1 [Helianthus annuus]KAF5814935.1 putative transcription factor bHLH family [Helianthus annuus]KAJ0774314.1 putative transcription factor bHLH family [Helianthus annuus]KAJ0936260.1 putative transcription factor bHLH family [Helianthus annuus]KAJ0944175.1 putative transcription factor bHLH family [Helianthus annuus]
MADNWWDSSSRTRPCLDSVSVSNSINLFQDTQTATTDDTTTTTATNTGAATATNTMMGLGLPSQSLPQSLDWNQALLRGDHKSDSGFRNLLQDQDSLSSNTTNFQLENNLWRPQKMYPASSQDSSSDFKQINVRGFHLDQQMPDSDSESIITCQGLNSSFQNMDLYGAPSTIMQSLFGSDHNQQQDSNFDQNQGMSNYSLYQSSYGALNVPGGGGGGELSTSNWSKYPPQPLEFGVNSPSKVQLDMGGNQLHFANNARFWNASAAGGVNDIRSSFFPSLQMQLPLSSFEDKPKITPKVVKESASESSSNKRPRNENQSTLQANFKVKKEKMGDRITALQQLVSPFGKTDTASVLSEAIDYIKFLHEQVGVLSTPYMKNGAPILQQQQQQTLDKPPEGARQDLRSRGLCLVPVSSTFPVTHETTVDFWTPTFGGTFR